MDIRQRIRDLKIDVPHLEKPVGLYAPAVKSGKMVYTSGQLPMIDGRLMFKGRVGKEVTMDNAKRAAKQAVSNAIAALEWACGDLNRVKQIVRLNGYICSAIGFNDQAKVMNDASDLVIQLFGDEIGMHSRTTIGVLELPMASCLEIDLIAEVK